MQSFVYEKEESDKDKSSEPETVTPEDLFIEQLASLLIKQVEAE
jgi:hypothetical protein